ncbi:HlyD family secretion protein [Pararhizobium haloflavum]|uniref:HlyD family secretion protein n=1 Tax=Pararhizobium haloflavum TaxID=2037914 RepID=UPI000C190252|nr:HlyD family efflux transporter periplasmic adaptor subunit [Pararhizobium haloflavum]
MSLLCALPLVASLLASCTGADALAVGYVEGDYTLLAPTDVARVEAVLVARGDRVEAGEAVAELQKRDAELAVSAARAAHAEAQAELADLKKGKRPEEIAVLAAALSSAEAALAEAERVLGRTQDLEARGIATRAELDKAETARRTASAEVAAARANLEVARLPARIEAIEAATMRRDGARAALAQAEWQLSERTLRADAAGRVDDIVRAAGDVAGPQAPVVSMLPDGAVKLKLYLPEPSLSSVSVGTVLSVSCDGCPSGLSAKVSYIASEPEFTPPVLYSIDARQKLVYLVEARPDGTAAGLKPGQIVDVSFAGAPTS